MGKQRKNYPLRLSEELYAEIRRWADQEMRSVNGQIEFILKEAVRKRFKTKSDRPENESDEKKKSER